MIGPKTDKVKGWRKLRSQ